LIEDAEYHNVYGAVAGGPGSQGEMAAHRQAANRALADEGEVADLMARRENLSASPT